MRYRDGATLLPAGLVAPELRFSRADVHGRAVQVHTTRACFQRLISHLMNRFSICFQMQLAPLQHERSAAALLCIKRAVPKQYDQLLG